MIENTMKAVIRALTISLATLGLFILCGPANAANYTFPGAMPAGCSGSDGNYTCSSLALGYNDTITIAGTKPATIAINGTLSTNTSTINASGLASDLALVVTGALTTGYRAVLNANVSAASVDASGGGTEVTYGGSVAATSGNLVFFDKATVAGSVTSTTGTITVGQNSKVTGAVASTSGAITIGYRPRSAAPSARRAVSRWRKKAL